MTDEEMFGDMSGEEILLLQMSLIEKFTKDAKKQVMKLHGAGLRKQRTSPKERDDKTTRHRPT